MGKAQIKKKTAKRHNPIRVPDTHLGGGRADGKANPEKERQLLPVIEKVCSGYHQLPSFLPRPASKAYRPPANSHSSSRSTLLTVSGHVRPSATSSRTTRLCAACSKDEMLLAPSSSG